MLNYFVMHVRKGKRIGQRSLTCNHPLMEGEVCIESGDDWISVRKVSITERAITRTLQRKKGWSHTTMLIALPKGDYIYDEEDSNEDIAMFYLKEES